VSCSFDNTVRVWDANTSEPIHTMEGHTAEVSAKNFVTMMRSHVFVGKFGPVFVASATESTKHKSEPTNQIKQPHLEKIRHKTKQSEKHWLITQTKCNKHVDVLLQNDAPNPRHLTTSISWIQT
jgi:WD40 repeat protein